MGMLIGILATLLITVCAAGGSYRIFRKKKHHKVLSLLGALSIGALVFFLFVLALATESYIWASIIFFGFLMLWIPEQELEQLKSINNKLISKPSTNKIVETTQAKPKTSNISSSTYSYSSPTNTTTESTRRKSSKVIEFTYTNAQGETSEREVRVDSVDDTYIEGYCYTAGDTRTFRLDRIEGMIWQNNECFFVDEWLEKQGVTKKKSSKPKAQKKSTALEICFTGFSKDDREHLETLAEIYDFKVRKTVTKNLNFLVTGDNAGPTKMSAAIDVGATLIDEDEFREMIETGEIPEY